MYKKLSLVFLAAFFYQSAVNAQKTVRVLSFKTLHATVNSGMVMGESYFPYYNGQVIAGLKKGKMFGGIGAGIDYYNNKRSVPVFVSVSGDLYNKRKTPFAFLQAGYNISAVQDKYRQFRNDNAYSQKGGLFFETGMGYKFNAGKKLQWGPSLSYSCKKSGESGTEYWYASPAIFPAPKPEPESYKYTFYRIGLKINFWF